MKKEKGITLIALIITIIVMLILVGVTINIAINGGLFGTAQEATKKMGREISREKLMGAMIGAYDNNGYFVKANVVLPEGMNWDTEDSNCIIDENGEKFYIDPSNGTVSDNKMTGEIDRTKAYDISFKSADSYTSEFLASILENEEDEPQLTFYSSEYDDAMTAYLDGQAYVVILYSEGVSVITKPLNLSQIYYCSSSDPNHNWYYSEDGDASDGDPTSSVPTLTSVKIATHEEMEGNVATILTDEQLRAITASIVEK